MSKKDYSLKRSGNKKLLEMVAAVKKIDPDFEYDSDVKFDGLGYFVTVRLIIRGNSYKALGAVDNPDAIDEKYLDVFYLALKLAGVGIPYPDADMEKAAGLVEEIRDVKDIDCILETNLQHIVMNHITKLGKDFKKVFENYKVTDPAMLTPKICKLYLKSEIEKGESIEI